TCCFYFSVLFFYGLCDPLDLHSFPTRRSSDLVSWWLQDRNIGMALGLEYRFACVINKQKKAREAHATDSRMHLRRSRCAAGDPRSEEHTSELQSLRHLVCRLLLEKKKNKQTIK